MVLHVGFQHNDANPSIY
jgi:hypothetical protein